MKGFYLYCIRVKNGPKVSAKGIDGGKVFVISYQDLEAVVSEVSLDKFGSKEIQNKALENLKWIEEKALHHEGVIEEGMGKKLLSLIPMQFGLVFKTRESLMRTLTKHYNQFQKTLRNLRGKQEWGVKVFLNEDTFKKNLEEKNEKVLAKKKEIESMSKGMAFFAQKQIDQVMDEEKDKKLDEVIGDIYKILGRLASSKNKTKVLEKDFTGKMEEMVLNSFYLVEKSKLAQFQKMVQDLKKKYTPQGFIIEMTGPWPSYHFA